MVYRKVTMDNPRALIVVDILDLVALDLRQTLDGAGYATELILYDQATPNQIFGVKPDVIFMHHNLPALAGVAVYQFLQNDVRVNQIPVVALAAHKEVATRLVSFADVVLVRPLNYTRFANLLSLARSTELPKPDQAAWDALTGFYPPSFFTARLNQAIQKLRTNASQHFNVFSVNLAPLMQYEKKFGKEYRQQILQGAVRVLRSVLRPGDIVSHFETEQFLVLIENTPERFAPVSIADRMQHEFDEFLTSAGLKNRIKIDIGVLRCESEYKSSDEVLQEAHLAVQAAQHNGQNKYKLLHRSPKHGHYFVGNESLFSA